MIAIVDYGVGNLFSLTASLNKLGLENAVTSDAARVASADRVILPGVGAFGDAARRLRESGLWDVVLGVANAGKPLMGICLGMQLLFERSFEFGTHEGLALLPGSVVPLEGAVPGALQIPHMGWNALRIRRAAALLRNTREGDHMYFVHSFYATGCEDALLADAEYGVSVPAVVGRGNVVGCQFHPEKSGACGLGLLKAFAETEDTLC